jgi:YfiR/HmsC-like
MGRVTRRAIQALQRALAPLLLACGVAAAAAPVSEYQLKAVFLFNFAHFVEWPPAALPRDDAPFVIGVLGKDPFGASLEEVLRGENVNGHPLAVARYQTAAEIRGCQILFIPAAEIGYLDAVLAALKGRSTLTVTDADAPAVRGVIIALVKRDNRIRLRIDLQAAKAGNLTISSKLLRPAEIVGAGG